jgi:hypothetical protein
MIMILVIAPRCIEEKSIGVELLYVLKTSELNGERGGGSAV